MSLVATVVAALNAAGCSHALIGATAMAAHGVSRSTMDIDLLVVGREHLEAPVWDELRSFGLDVEVRRGDSEDPLLGVVRIRQHGESPLDIIIAYLPWQQRILERANPTRFADTTLPVATAADLVLLKLYAGSPQDLWDVQRLLDANGAAVVHQVDDEISALPAGCRHAWESVRRP